MSQKISALNALAALDDQADLLAIVDTSAGETKKVTLANAIATRSVAGMMSALDKDRATVRRSRSELFQDFANGVGDMLAVVSGAGAAVGTGIGIAGEIGTVGLATGTTTTGRAAVGTGQTTLVLGDGATAFVGRVKLQTLADGTDDYTVYAGLGDAFTAEPSNGVYFAYIRGSSTNWLLKSAAGGVRTTVDTGIAVGTIYVHFEIQINAGNTSAQAFINGVAVGTPITTNLPSAGVLHLANIIKSAGTNSRTGTADLLGVLKDFTTPR